MGVSKSGRWSTLLLLPKIRAHLHKDRNKEIRTTLLCKGLKDNVVSRDYVSK